MENKICTSIEQSNTLLKLGINLSTSDMCWDLLDGSDNQTPLIGHFSDFGDITEFMPMWSLLALIKLMPPSILTKYNGTYILRVEWTLIYDGYYPQFVYRNTYDEKRFLRVNILSKDIIDDAYNMVVWLLKNNYIKKIE